MSWESVKIPNVLFFQEGPGVRNTQFTNHGVKLLNVGNINFGNLNLDATKIYISEEEAYGKYKHFLVDEGDLLIASSGIVVNNFHNKITWASKEHLPLCLNTSTIRFKTLDPNVLDIRYFSYFLKTRLFADQLAKLITGSAQLNFGSSHLKQIRLPLPPLATQKRIAEILDAAEALRRKDQELLKKYDELAQAIFIDMFGDPVKNEKGWEVKKLDAICSKITDGEHGTVNRLANGKPYLMARNIRDGFIDFTETDFISEADHNRIFKRCNPEHGDLLLVCVGATIGRVCLMNSNDEFSLARSVALIKPKKNLINSKFLFAIFKSDFIQLQIKAANNSSAQAGLYTGKIKDLNIFIPPIELQNEFEIRINVLLEQSQCIDINKSDALFKSLIQKAFNGQLVA